MGRTADHQVRVKKAIEEGKQKLISLYLSHVEKAAISPIHECESLTKTQKKQAKKYIEEREAAAATQAPIKKRKVLDTNQIPALTSTYITWKDHTTKQN